MTDLEIAIRDALISRADSVTVHREELIRRRRRWLPPTLAAALVIALVAITVVLVNHRNTSTPAASGSSPFVGYRWKLVALDDRQGHLALPASTTAAVSFGSHGQMAGDDTVHTLSARYRVVASGYEPDAMTVTANGLAGRPSVALKRTLAAVGSCFSSAHGDSKPPVTTPVRASVSGDRLVLHTSYGVLTFVRAGAAP